MTLLQALFLDVAATQLMWDSSRKSLSLSMMDLQSSLNYPIKYFLLCFMLQNDSLKKYGQQMIVINVEKPR